MIKDFDTWNANKKKLDSTPITKYAHPREIWWCSLGLNIGVEVNGKNKNFERPVVVIKVYNKESLLILPLTSKQKDDPFHYEFTLNRRPIWAKLTQLRVISSKRLERRIEVLNKEEFDKLKAALLVSM